MSHQSTPRMPAALRNALAQANLRSARLARTVIEGQRTSERRPVQATPVTVKGCFYDCVVEKE